jgi:NADPH:quinone reductase-like Zn-dependent oxidoreductase
MKGTMKAVLIHNYRGPEISHCEDTPRPKAEADEVLVRVHAAEVNPIDWKVRGSYVKPSA